MKEILYFDSMITPKIITFVYWLLLLCAVLSGLGSMFSGFGLGSIIRGLVIIVVGGIGARIWCELLIVLFKIHENIKKIAEK